MEGEKEGERERGKGGGLEERRMEGEKEEEKAGKKGAD